MFPLSLVLRGFFSHFWHGKGMRDCGELISTLNTTHWTLICSRFASIFFDRVTWTYWENLIGYNYFYCAISRNYWVSAFFYKYYFGCKKRLSIECNLCYVLTVYQLLLNYCNTPKWSLDARLSRQSNHINRFDYYFRKCCLLPFTVVCLLGKNECVKATVLTAG